MNSSRAVNVREPSRVSVMCSRPLRPVAMAFVPYERGNGADATTDAEGRYTLRYAAHNEGAVVGRSRVEIRTGGEGRDADGNLVETPERLPGVELRASKLAHTLPFVGCDNRDLGRIVADHFIDNGFRNFAVFDLDTERYFEERRDNFRAHLASRGHACHEHHAPARGERPANWERHQADVARWVAALPKPVGIFACIDQLAFWLLDACRRAGVAVPEEVAVVGAENDETLCTMARPQLSSVAFDGERVGYEAAGLLDRLMAGAPPPAEPLLVPPKGIVVRQSSDIMAIDDPHVVTAIRYIREHACHGINVADVVKHAGLSRTLLERRIRRATGRTPGEEIVKVRFGRVRQLLAETDLSLAAIADRCGFEHPQYMAESFKKHFGITPGAYRTGGRKS